MQLCTADAHKELLKKVKEVYEKNKTARKDAGLADAVDSGAEEEESGSSDVGTTAEKDSDVGSSSNCALDDEGEEEAAGEDV